MITKNKRLFIVGDSAFAEVAYEYFTYDSEYEVIGFAVEKKFITKTTLFNLPIIPLEEIQSYYEPSSDFFYAALVYTNLNRLRTRLYLEVKQFGFKPASYVSSSSFVWHNSIIGEHCFIFENNVVQPFVSIGNNCVLWSGNHIGHHSIIKNNCFISSQVVISGFCEIGENCFLGINSSISNNISIGDDNWIGQNVPILSSTRENQVFVCSEVSASNVPAKRFQKVRT